MFKSVVSFVIILSFQKQMSQEPAAINHRIEVLKQLINDEIQEERYKASTQPTTSDPIEYYQYIMTEPDDTPIKPIMQYHDKTHKQKKHKHHEKKDKKKKKTRIKQFIPTAPNVTTTHSRITPADVYYRRLFVDEEDRNKQQKWTHCLDLITPYLNGLKDSFSSKKVDMKDGTVVRLIQLISINTTSHSKEDIVSILYQISNLPLRIFQWDVDAITTLFNVLIRRSWHDFRGLKAGIKALFQKWHLDTSNIVSFVEQTRVFRPPCIEVSEFGGSTKSSKSIRYTKPTVKNSDSDCDN